MSSAAVDGPRRDELQTLATTATEEIAAAAAAATSTSLYDALRNSLILGHTAPHLPISGLLRLAATSRAFRALIFEAPGVFRHLDLTPAKAVQSDIDRVGQGGAEVWRNKARLDENSTEDDFYLDPLRRVFSALRRQNILQNVHTLVLDGLSVTSELCHEIISDPAFGVRILSIRDVGNLNQEKLRQALQYACRSTRPKGSPRLKALYVFGSKDAAPTAQQSAPSEPPSISSAGWTQTSRTALASSPLQQDGDAWWSKKSRIMTRPIAAEWASCMLACESLIAFDAVLCRGPRHRNSCSQSDGSPAAAMYAVSACDGCGDAPEGLVLLDTASAAALPLLAPPPLLSSSLRSAVVPKKPCEPFVARCFDCIRERYCTGCQKWWCESCYQLLGQASGDSTTSQVIVVDEEATSGLGGLDLGAPGTKFKPRVSKSCWECNNNCDTCISHTQRVCRKCCAGYCIIHNEGSSMAHCDWCVSRGRGLGRL